MKITDIKEQKELLENNLEKINIVVSAKLGIPIKFEITEKTDYKKQIFLGLSAQRNFVKDCGIMKHALNEVTIDTFGMWWQDDGSVIFELDFYFCIKDGGSNGFKAGVFQVKDNMVIMMD